jgi:hypothetical protein
MITEAELEKIYRDAKQDPSLFSTIDPNELLKELEKERNRYIEDKTTKDMIEEIKQSIEEEFGDELEKNIQKTMIQKLIGYRYADELDVLHIGKNTRWIQKYKDDIKVTNGGLLLNTIFTEDGINLVIKLWNGRINKIRFDDCLVYQKMSFGEQLILMVADYIKNNS